PVPPPSRFHVLLSRHFIALSPFSVYCSGALLALHSFPTRRSSDLAGSSARWRRPRRGSSRHELAERRSHRHRRREGGEGRGQERSEEHTSELQSRFDLVCRLLLEKKKEK